MHSRILIERRAAAQKAIVRAAQRILGAEAKVPSVPAQNEADQLALLEFMADVLTVAAGQPAEPVGVDLKTAIAASTVDELAALPGLGKASAQKLKDWAEG